MNQDVLEAVKGLNDIPQYVNRVSHCTDVERICEVALTVYKTNESISEVKDYIEQNLFKNHSYKEGLIRDCKNYLDIAPQILKYIKYGE